MIDFTALSRCDFLVGSHQSSFSILAARYGRIPHVTIGQETSIHSLDG